MNHPKTLNDPFILCKTWLTTSFMIVELAQHSNVVESSLLLFLIFIGINVLILKYMCPCIHVTHKDVKIQLLDFEEFTCG